MLLALTILGELIFVGSLLLGLYRLKTWWGLAPFYVFVGSTLFFQTGLYHFAGAAGIGGYRIAPGPSILFCSTLFAILLIYIKEGSTIAQRFITAIGLVK